ncbi:MAG TPA: FAD-dependent oxidoreductase [Steroidobacteraceae bacterium]|nr:FAD-dependent oxidoreductase [Steroidobacteraceae bacterium]
MATVRKVLVIGGGCAGMSAAIQLAKAGVAVDLVEIDPQWRPLGAGITITGPTLRALETIGVYEEFKRVGYVSDGVVMHAADGRKTEELSTPPPQGSKVEGNAGIMRPELARILADATRRAKVDVRLGCTYTAINEVADGVEVSFTDQSTRKYDLVIGSDGVNSSLRALLIPEFPPPQYIGQSIWRAVLKRPAHITQPHIWFGHHLKLGMNPVSQTHMYVFITEERPKKTHIDRSEWPTVFTDMMRQFPDPFIQSLIPEAAAPAASVDYRPIANLLVPLPWNRGRVVLIGDATAGTTPHLASGAGIGIESALVLAEELVRAPTLQAALDAFHARRWPRCQLVIGNSERICRLEMTGGDPAEVSRIMRESMAALREPI